MRDGGRGRPNRASQPMLSPHRWSLGAPSPHLLRLCQILTYTMRLETPEPYPTAKRASPPRSNKPRCTWPHPRSHPHPEPESEKPPALQGLHSDTLHRELVFPGERGCGLKPGCFVCFCGCRISVMMQMASPPVPRCKDQWDRG